MPNRVPLLVALSVAALLAGACTVIVPADRPTAVDQPRPAPTAPATDVPRPLPSPVLPSDVEFVAFEVGPETIYPDSVVYFRFQVRRGGYLTVSALSPDGRVTMLARDVRVGTGPRIYPEPGSDVRIQASGAGRRLAGAGGVDAAADPGQLHRHPRTRCLDRRDRRQPRRRRRRQRRGGPLRGSRPLNTHRPRGEGALGYNGPTSPPPRRAGPAGLLLGGVMEGRRRGGP
jgi:hypothetical protein